MSRTRVRRLARTVALATAVGAWALGHAVAGASSPGSHRYVVRPGDTLWSIARRVEPGSDPRAVVDRLAAANDVEAGTLIPGRSLVLP